MRIVILVAGEAEPLEPRTRGVLSLLRIGIEDLQAEPHVVESAAPGHQAIILEHDADLAAKEVELPERVAPDHFRLAGAWFDESGNDLQPRGLAGAGLAKDRDDLALCDLERQFLDSDKIAASVRTPERLADVFETNDRIDA